MIRSSLQIACMKQLFVEWRICFQKVLVFCILFFAVFHSSCSRSHSFFCYYANGSLLPISCELPLHIETGAKSKKKEMRQRHEDLCALAAFQLLLRLPTFLASIRSASRSRCLTTDFMQPQKKFDVGCWFRKFFVPGCRSSLWHIVQDGVLTSHDYVTMCTYSQLCGSEAWNPTSRCSMGRMSVFVKRFFVPPALQVVGYLTWQ